MKLVKNARHSRGKRESGVFRKSLGPRLRGDDEIVVIDGPQSWVVAPQEAIVAQSMSSVSPYSIDEGADEGNEFTALDHRPSRCEVGRKCAVPIPESSHRTNALQRSDEARRCFQR